MLASLTGGLLGLFLGMRHALEPDHLAAISTMLTDRPGARRAAGLGAAWGLGHTAALLVVAMVLLAARAEMSPALVDAFEFVVALVLILLGARSIHGAIRPAHHDAHADADTDASAGALGHRHDDEPTHFHAGRFTIAGRPFLVGICHGLAGSGALTVLALAHMPTTSGALGYVAVFGIGSAAGMSLLSILACWPLARIAGSDRGRRALGLAAGGIACSLGVVWGWPMMARLIAG